MAKHRESGALRDSLCKRLGAYAVSVGAAAGVMAAAPAAEAQIVYTPEHQTIHCSLSSCSQTIFIDLNHDGVTDFRIHLGYSARSHWDVLAVRGDGAEHADISQGYYGSAMALPFGVSLGGLGLN